MAYRDLRMICPRCEVELDGNGRCGTCSGRLVAEVMLTDLSATPWERTDRAAPVGCPVCAERMLAFRVMGVEVEKCERDALVWFDGGELGFLRALMLTE